MTVGPGFTPGLLSLPKQALAGFFSFEITAGGEFHPALRTVDYDYQYPT